MRFTNRPFTLGFAAVLVVGVAAAYWNSVTIGFDFDDVYVITSNPSIRSLANIPRFFYDPLAHTIIRENADLRPILLITYAFNYALSGLQPWSYHLLNLLIHLVAAALVFLTVRNHLWWPASERGPDGAARLPAAAAALFFALAPLNSQPLVYMSARSALLCTTLYLGAFYASLRGRRRLTAGLHALALLTKAVAVTLPVMILAYDFLYRDRKRYRTVKRYLADWQRLVPLVALPVLLDIAYLLYRQALIPAWVAETYHQPYATPWIWFMSEWSAYLYYVRLFVWPDALSIDHDFPHTFSLLQPRAWLPLSVLIAWIGGALRWQAHQPMVAFASLWFFVTLAPESTVAPLAEVINDHRPYIGTALGLSVLLAWALHRAAYRLGRRAPVAFAAVALTLCAAAIPVTRHRIWEWQDSVRLWVSTTVTSPNNGRAWMNAGVSMMGRGELVAARRYLERARELTPGYPYVYMNLSVLNAYEGHLPEALEAAATAVRLNPKVARTHFFQAQALEKLGRYEEAAAAYQRALDIDPRDAEARAALGRARRRHESSAAAPAAEPPSLEALMDAGVRARHTLHENERAAELFRQVLEKNPTHYGATYQLAAVLDALGKPDEARPLWEKVLVMAEGFNDAPTIQAARARLGR